MKPYYTDSTGNIVIYHGDCREILPSIKADVVVTDPPYGMAYVSNRSRFGPSAAIAGDGSTGVRDEMLALWRGPALVFGKWSYPRPANVRHVLIWDKGDDPGTGDLSMPWGNSHEEVYVIGKGWTGKRGSNVLRRPTPRGDERPEHPTPKSVALMRDLLERCPEGTILDPFMGSGTTLRAAKDLGRKAIGIEIEERYCEIAAKRLAQEVLPFAPS